MQSNWITIKYLCVHSLIYIIRPVLKRKEDLSDVLICYKDENLIDMQFGIETSKIHLLKSNSSKAQLPLSQVIHYNYIAGVTVDESKQIPMIKYPRFVGIGQLFGRIFLQDLLGHFVRLRFHNLIQKSAFLGHESLQLDFIATDFPVIPPRQHFPYQK